MGYTTPNPDAKAPIKNPHPLRLLSASEIQSLSRLIKRKHHAPIHMFYTMDLIDPDKTALWDWEGTSYNGCTCFHRDAKERNDCTSSICGGNDKNCNQNSHSKVFNNDNVTENSPSNHPDTDLPNSRLKRRVKVSITDRNWELWEYIVHMSNYHDGQTLSIESRNRRIGVQPLIRLEEFYIAEKVAKSDPTVKKYLTETYGIKDLDLLCIDPWSAGYHGNQYEIEHRVVRCLMWHRVSDPEDNRFAHPVSGICIVVDINNQKVLEISDYLQNKPPVPMERSNFNPSMRKKDLGSSFKVRSDIKPLDIVQPQGPSFEVEENHVSWQGWSFRVGFFPREGLVLYNLKFQGRPVCFKVSTPEMSVPYSEPSYRLMGGVKNALDSAEYGLGYCGNSLSLGCDCLGEIYYFDAHLHTYDGTPYQIKNAICMHEEDAGIMWKHCEWRTGENVTVRGRKLIVSFIATIGNYLYAFYYILNQEGQIHLDVHLHGILNTIAIHPDEKDVRYGTQVLKGVLAGAHQHLIAARIDMCVDGNQNCISECNMYLEEDDSKNAFGNAFNYELTRLDSQHEAQRDNCTETSRFWKVYNSNILNRMGTPVSYEFHPGSNIRPLSKKNSYMMKRCPWLEHHLFVTQYHENQQFPSGEYGNQSTGENHETLRNWVKDDKSLVDQNLVLWHYFGVTHLPRLEEFPIMNVHHLRGFKLQPSGFFDENPCLDLPKRDSCCKSKF